MLLKYKIRQSQFIVIFIAFVFPLEGCEKLVEVEPPTTSNYGSNVYQSDGTAAAVLTGIYTNMSRTSFSGGSITSMSLFLGLSADELNLYNGVSNTTYIGYFKNALTSFNTENADFWRLCYPIIFIANSAIDGISKSNTLTPGIKQHLIGEAKFVRAFCYFYLANLYGDIPLVTGIDYTINSVMSRTSRAEIWKYIIFDLKESQDLLSDQYLDASILNTTSARVRPTKWAATALLARVYLFCNDWANAELEATKIINNTSSFSLPDLNNVFLKNSLEAIWQLQPVNSRQNTQDARLFILPSSGPTSNLNNPVFLNTSLLNSFENDDLRYTSWIKNITAGSTKYYFPYKYKLNALNAPVNEYLMVLRLGEQYLIRAEARAQQGNISGAQNDLNVIRARAGLAITTASNKQELLTTILHERQVELFSEWGHRWLDLKRTNSIDSVMISETAKKGGIWSPYKAWYPIPQSDLNLNPNLVQNNGY
jgi:starch-binding outer membrane protein, SusD/RagB family